MTHTNSKSSITDVMDSQTLAQIVDELLNVASPEMFLTDLEEIAALAVSSPELDGMKYQDRSDLVLTFRKLAEFFRSIDRHIKSSTAAG